MEKKCFNYLEISITEKKLNLKSTSQNKTNLNDYPQIYLMSRFFFEKARNKTFYSQLWAQLFSMKLSLVEFEDSQV